MSKLQDSVLLSNLFEDSKAREFRSSEWKYIQDTNNGSYNAGNITFRTNHIRNVWKSWYDAYVAIPISVSSSGSAYDGGELVAYKQSFLSSVYGLHAKLNGTTVLNDTNVQYINNLRLLVNKSVDWANINGPEIGYAKDSSASVDSSMGHPNSGEALTGTITIEAADNTLVGSGTAFAVELDVGDRIVTAGGRAYQITEITSATVAEHSSETNTGEAAVAFSRHQNSADHPNEDFNEGFFRRAAYLSGNYNYRTNASKPPVAADHVNWIASGPTPHANNSDFGTAGAALSYSRVLELPLRYLHPFFESLNFPMVNDDFELVIQTHNNSSQTFDQLNVPTGSLAGAMVIRATCRLYYRELEFQPDDASKINDMLRNGMVKRVRYNVCDVYSRLANTSTTFSELVTSSAINPVRLWVQMYAQGMLALGVASNAPQNATIRPLTSQLKINNVNLFDDRLETVDEHWQELKRQLAHIDDNKSQINKMDYINNFIGFNVYDIERYGDDKVNEDTSNELVLQMTKPSTNCDILMLLEKREVVELQMSDGNLKAIVR